VSGRTILEAIGIEPHKLNLEYLGYQDSVDAMLDNRIAAANIPAGAPASSISMLFAQLGDEKVRILEFTRNQLNEINRSYPVWKRYIIRNNVYPRLKRDVFTIAQSNFLGVVADLSEETVYIITKTIFENLPFLYKYSTQQQKAIKFRECTQWNPCSPTSWCS